MFKVCAYRLLFWGWLPLAVAVAQAQTPQETTRSFLSGTHRSVSDQFIVHTEDGAGRHSYDYGEQTNFVRLEPDLLTVSCERIKSSLLNLLGSRDEWHGRIYLDLHRHQGTDEEIVIAPVLSSSRWDYHVELPDLLDQSRLVPVMVRVLMQEMADRGVDHNVELPLWLAEGMSREVQRGSSMQLVVEPPHTFQNGITLTRLMRDNRAVTKAGQHPDDWLDPLAKARDYLRNSAPLTLEQLSWPTEGVLDGDQAESYRSTAQLLVHQLLQLPGGRVSMLAFVKNSQQHLNWQVSFLQAFHSDFTTQLAFEKWWTLQVAELTGRDMSRIWSREESWQKLDELLRPVIDMRASLMTKPTESQATLQDIIRKWDVPRQKALFREKAQQLFLLRVHVSQELMSLTEDYRRELENYLRIRDRVIYVPVGRTLFESRLDEVAHDTIRRLDELDALRQQLFPKQPAPASVATSDAINH